MKNVLEVALSLEGYPAIKYKNPLVGNNIQGFDCSGFVQYVLLNSGIGLNYYIKSNKLRHSEEFFDFFGFLVHTQARLPADLVFFSRKGTRPTHVGIYLGEDKMIHSPGLDGKNVEIVLINDYCKSIKHLIGTDKNYPQIYFENPIGYKRIAINNLLERFQKIS